MESVRIGLGIEWNWSGLESESNGIEVGLELVETDWDWFGTEMPHLATCTDFLRPNRKLILNACCY